MKNERNSSILPRVLFVSAVVVIVLGFPLLRWYMDDDGKGVQAIVFDKNDPLAEHEITIVHAIQQMDGRTAAPDGFCVALAAQGQLGSLEATAVHDWGIDDGVFKNIILVHQLQGSVDRVQKNADRDLVAEVADHVARFPDKPFPDCPNARNEIVPALASILHSQRVGEPVLSRALFVSALGIARRPYTARLRSKEFWSRLVAIESWAEDANWFQLTDTELRAAGLRASDVKVVQKTAQTGWIRKNHQPTNFKGRFPDRGGGRFFLSYFFGYTY